MKGKTLESLMFLEQKHTWAVKGHLVADGSKQQNLIQDGAAPSPTVRMDLILITSAIEATEGWDVAV